MAGASSAVFLSYASEDAEAAGRIAAALSAAGIEVWFDRTELRGGDAWDRQIRLQIHDCRLFVPIISANSDARAEGYFRREWRLAVDRTHDLSDRVAFLLPVVIDSTSEQTADVPDAFRHVQWTRLRGGETSPSFVEQVQRLLLPPQSVAAAGARQGAALTGLKPTTGAARTSLTFRPRTIFLMVMALLIASTIGYVAVNRPYALSKPAPPKPPLAGSAPSSQSVIAAPPHSVAVLPFANLSGRQDQEYFSDGITDEILNSLVRIKDIQVAARTSSFSFKGKDTDIGEIARRLNVATVLEGSVRRSGNTIRVTAQLDSAVTGFHLWSQSYDRPVEDVLKIQTDIARAVAERLKIILLGDISQNVEYGGTHNPHALDAYFHALKAFQSRHDESDLPAAIDFYNEALRLDARFALALARRSYAVCLLAGYESGFAQREGYKRAESDARQAIALAPELAEAHVALAFVSEWLFDFARASEEYKRAIALAPGSADVLRLSGEFATLMGRTDAGLAALRRALILDPLSRETHYSLGSALFAARRFRESAAAHADAIKLDPAFNRSYGTRGIAFYALGDMERARTSCEARRNYWQSQECLALVYRKIGRITESEAELKKVLAEGDDVAYQLVEIYAQWGNVPKALEWLDTAMRLHDSGLEHLKVSWLLDPIRGEPRFQAIEQALNFPK